MDDKPKPKKVKIRVKAMADAQKLAAAGMGSIVSKVTDKDSTATYIGNDDNAKFKGGENVYSDPKTGAKRKPLVKVKY